MQNKLAATPIAIVGMACRLPGAGNLDEYWQLVRSGGTAICEIPPDRLDRELYYDSNRGVVGKTYATRVGLVQYPPFNERAFPTLSAEQIAETDVAHLTVCDVAAAALRHAGYDPFQLPQRNAGVYVGHAGGSPRVGSFVYASLVEETAQYLKELPSLQGLDPKLVAGVIAEIVQQVRTQYPHRQPGGGPDLSANVAAGVISRAFGLSGPHMVIDAACASSLMAMMLGVRALQQGRIDMAIAGGASYCKAESLVLFSQAQSVSPNESRPFDANAEGLISSEGYVVIVLKTLERALADGNQIYAVLRGIGMSSDGKGKSLWAPRKEGQSVAIERAYAGGLDPGRLQYIEAHATSTQLGDATELAALCETLAPLVPADCRIPLGSVKANIGHTLETAGLAGLVKAVLALQNHTVPPAINVRSLNPKVAWDKIPFFVPTQALAWPEHADGHPRRAAVNAFGIGGLNIHLVLDEYVAAKPKSFYLPRLEGTEGAAVRVISPDEPIAVVGAGALLPGAFTLEAFWDLLVSGRDPKTDAPADRWNAEIFYQPGADGPWRSPTRKGGYLAGYQYDWRRHKVPPKQVQNANPLQFMLLDATEQALQDAGYGPDKQFDRKKVGAVVGTIFGGDFADRLQMGIRLPEFKRTLTGMLKRHGLPDDQIQRACDEFQEVLFKYMPALLDETGSFTCSTLASRITKTFDLMGGALAIDASSSSGMAALDAAMGVLRSGECDMMVCAAGQRTMDLITYEGFSMGGILSGDDVRSPFDARMTGVVPGEGAAVLLLKRESDARRDGDPIRAVIRGIGACTNFDDPHAATRVAMERALESARVAPQSVTAIETAPLGRAGDDQKEVESIVSVYGKTSRPKPLLIGSIVGQIGYTGGATGIAGLVKATLALDHKAMPPALPVETPAPYVQQHADVVRTIGALTPLEPAVAGGYSAVGVTAGTGTGLSYHVLMDDGSKVPAPSQRPTKSLTRTQQAVAAVATTAQGEPWKIIRFAAPSLAELAAVLKAQEANSAALLANPPAPFSPDQRVRAAIVASTPDDLAKKLTLACKQIEKHDAREVLERKGIFWRTASAVRPRIALVFPGQSSQYAGMLESLVNESPAAAEALATADRAMAAQDHPSFAQIAWREGDQLGKNVWRTQISVLLADWILYKALSALGIKAEVAAGHSYGEFPALVAAGAWTLDEAIRITQIRCHLVDNNARARGSMLATTAPGEVAEQVVRQLGGDVYVANYNAPDQTVLAGDSALVTQAEARIKELGFNALPIAVPCAFHTPLLSEVVAEFRKHVAGAAITAPRIPVLGTTTNRPLDTPEKIKASLGDQLVNPVRYAELVTLIAREQETIFVEVGPQQVLSRLHKRILPADNLNYIATDNARRPGIEQLCCVRAMLECSGALDGPTADSQPSVAAPAPRKRGRIVHFDATQRRKEKAHAAGQSQARTVAQPAPVAVAAPARPAPVAPAQPVPVAPAPSAPVAKATAPTRAPQPAVPAPAAAAVTSPKVEDLESFLIDFVVEETGYPPEIVELDADLEGDLGIDSIKKAQLFAELGERFSLVPDESMSLDDFTTLRHVLAYLQQALGGAAAPAQTAPAAPLMSAPAAAPVSAPPPPAPAIASAPAPAPAGNVNLGDLETFLVNFVVEETGYPPEIVELDADLEGDLGIDSIKKAQLFAELGERFSLVPDESMSLDDFTTLRHVLAYLQQALGGSAAPAQPASAQTASTQPAISQTAPAPAAPSTPAAPAMAPASTPASNVDMGDLETFLVNFVVEETGYPPEIVELDADLEGDLGIDSIKKAQLFAELGERFSLVPDESMSLDDFTTLRHVLSYLQEALGQSAPPRTAAVVAPAQLAAPTIPAVPASEPTPSPAPTATAIAPAPAPTPATTGSVDLADLETFLVNFVVEETGYPPEIVELDADLEGDLGIDSIKKAQLFAELGEHFSLVPDESMSLDDFTTLRHVLSYLEQALSGSSAAPTEPAAPALAAPAPPVAPQPVAETYGSSAYPNGHVHAPSSNGSDGQPCTRLTGTPFEMGYQHGQAHCETIRRILMWLADAASNPAASTAPTFDSPVDASHLFDANEMEELRGIAKGAEVPLENVLVLNMLLHEASQRGVLLAVKSSGNATGEMIHALGEHLAELAGLPGGVTRVTLARFPAAGVPHVLLSIPGQLGGLCGINARGVAVSGTRLVGTTTSNQQGTILPLVVKRILEKAADVENAVEVLRQMKRSGSAGLCISQHETDRLCYVEFDGEALRIGDDRPGVVATNHSLLQPTSTRTQSDWQQRLQRVQGWYERWLSGGTVEQLQSALWHDFETEPAGNGATNGASDHETARGKRRISVVMRPASGDFWMTNGQSHAALPHFARVNVAEILQSAPPATGPAAKASPNVSPATPAAPPAAARAAQRVMKRYVLRMTECPVTSDPHAALDFQGPAAILGNNRRADALRARLMQLGCVVYDLPDTTDPDEAVVALGELWQRGPVPHLFLMMACDDLRADQPEDQPWDLSAARSLLVPFEVCRRWTEFVEQNKLQPRSTLVAVTMLGGDFGFEGGTPNILGGGIAGMLKAIRREYVEMGIKIVDVSPLDKPVTTADAVISELASRATEMEVGYQLGRRYLVRASAELAPKSGVNIRPGGVWVITGGARGVTAVVARELGKRFGLKLHLVGSSPLRRIDSSWRDLTDEQMEQLKTQVMREAGQHGQQPVEAWDQVKKDIEIDRNLHQIQADGVEATYHRCDVTDRAQVAAMLEEIRRTSGPIEGILHGAGVDFSCRFGKKKRENVERTIGAKVDGALALVALTRNDPLRYFIGFGSNSGRFGGHGQADYASASDMLCKLSGWIRSVRPECAACGFHWPSWSEVGMAMRPAIKAGLERSGLAFVSPEEGVAHLIDELEAGLPEQEVLIIDAPHFLDLDGTMTRPESCPPSLAAEPASGHATWQHEASRSQAGAIDTRDYPLIDRVDRADEPGKYIARSKVDPTGDIFLTQHRLEGKPFLAAVTMMELFAEAASCICPKKTVLGLSDLNIASGIPFHNERPQELSIAVTLHGNTAHCELIADYYNNQGQLLESGRVFSTGQVDLGDRPSVIDSPLPGTPVLPYNEFFYPSDRFVIHHGPCYRTLKQTIYQYDGGRAILEARHPLEMAGTRSGTCWLVPTAMIDGCLVACGTFSFSMLEGRVEIPIRYDRIRIVRLPREGERCIQRMYFRGIEGTGTRFDFVLFGDDGQPILALDGYYSVTFETRDHSEMYEEVQTVLDGMKNDGRD